ncbi:alpha/beta fold hydrolase, partial [Xanthovirga aplysinae]|uniref:alpha/beta fold hydrolase n=1 Tax=Xanthovirga aplysinae TaxID=2529853 RepID=UPI0012BD23D0
IMDSLNYSESGKGFPVVFLHGFCETHEVWKAFEEQLAYHFHVLCPDLPGFGKSKPLKEGFGLEEVAESIHLWLKDLEIEECILIGHSLGGYVSLAFAEKYSDMLRGFGLFHSSAFADDEEKKQVRNKTIQFVQKHAVDKFIEPFVPELFYRKRRKFLQEEIEKVIQIGITTPKESLIAYSKAMRDRKERIHVLEEFSRPVLFIAGDEDKAVPLEKTKAQAFLPKQHEVHILAQTGHMG